MNHLSLNHQAQEGQRRRSEKEGHLIVKKRRGNKGIQESMVSNDERTRIMDAYTDSFPAIEEKGRGYILFHKIQRAMRHVPNFTKTCNAILEAVMEEMDAENCSLMLKSEMSGELSIHAARGKSGGNHIPDPCYPREDRKRFKPGEGIAGLVLKEGREVMVSDVSLDPRFVRLSSSDSKLGSLICFPVRENDQVVGVFNLSHSKKGAFDEGDKLAISCVSDQIGAAFTFSHLFSERKERDSLMEDHRDPQAPYAKISSPHPFESIEGGETGLNRMFIYTSDKMHRIKEIIEQVANTDATVFIRGESGVGKEVVARFIHFNSFRRDKPFIKINCAALPQELLESELFGYDKGAFTGAFHQKPGKFELADGGTIFLDEIVEMSPSLQAKLLQVLQDGEFSRLGSKKDVRVDVRVLTATNQNVEKAIKDGQFREDLYYRLNVVNILIPPLRERKEEIPIFVQHFLNKYGKKFNKEIKPLSDQMMRILLQHCWLGNVRELENLIQRFLILGDEQLIVNELVSFAKEEVTPTEEPTSGKEISPSLREVHREAVRTVESETIRRALELTNWNRKKAAAMLHISYKALLYKIKAFHIDKKNSFLCS